LTDMTHVRLQHYIDDVHHNTTIVYGTENDSVTVMMLTELVSWDDMIILSLRALATRGSVQGSVFGY
jgi:hypothetical protein